MAWVASRSRCITNNGRACWTPPKSFANSLKRTNRNSNSKTNNFDREQYLYLTTRGRSSGLPREIEIWFTHRDGRFYLIAEYPTSHWLQNLKAHPETQVRVAGEKFATRARIVSAETEAELYRVIADLSRQKYGWGEGTIVELIRTENREPGSEN
jgi:deazaflavin-dependent oxidoreductase (nitroreductase family)